MTRASAALAGALWAAAALSVRAEEAESVPASCQADVERFCAGVQSGGGRIGACLKEHAAETSLPCQASRAGAEAVRARTEKAKRDETLRKARARQAKAEAACSADAKRLCKDADLKAEGALFACLDKRKPELSAFCREKLEALPRPKAPEAKP